MVALKPAAVQASTEAILHYKRKLNRTIEEPDSADVVLHCLTKLDIIRVNIDILQDTGIGKVVNQLKKSAIGDERISCKAREIVQKWKDIVAKEEEENGEDSDTDMEQMEEDTNEQIEESDGGSEGEYDLNPSFLQPEEPAPKYTSAPKSVVEKSQHSSKDSSHQSKSKERERSSSSKHRHESSSSSSSKKKKKDKDRVKDERKTERDDRKKRTKSIDEDEEDSKTKKRREEKEESEKHKERKKESEKEKSEHREKKESDKEKSEHREKKKESEHQNRKKEGEKHTDRSKEKEKKHRHSSSSSRDKEKRSSSSSKHKSVESIGFEEALMAVTRKESQKAAKSSSSNSSHVSKSISNAIAKNLSSGEMKPKKLLPPLPPPLPPLFDVPCDISPNYTPLKSRPIQPPPSRHSRLAQGQADDEALSALIQKSKNAKRSAVYSGSKRSAFKDSVPTLFQLCIHVLQEHVDDIAECGGLPYDILEPVLDRAKPDTLMTIEDYNPYLMEDTAELWERICRKTFPKEHRKEFESWRELYERCTTARQEKLDFLAIRVQQSYKSVNQNHRKTKLAYVDDVAKAPRNIQRAQERNGTGITLSTAQQLKQSGGPPRPRGEGRIRPDGATPSFSSFKQKPKMAPMMAKTMKMVKGLKVNFRR